jgi:ParB family chromosome partitioning protein
MDTDSQILADRVRAADPDALTELRLSIARNGLRMPVEVFEFAEPDGPCRYGLISGFRRLAAFRALDETARDRTRFAAIPAFVRRPASLAAAMNAMVEENAVRAEVSPWEQAMLAVIARDREVFETVDAAIDALYANLNRDKRRRLRVIAQLVETVDSRLVLPESWPQQRLLRLAAAVNRGFGPVIVHALDEAEFFDAGLQWRHLLPLVAESENPEIPAPRLAADGRVRPRRIWSSPLQSFRIRREKTRDGWLLRFSGRDAHGDFMDTVFDYIEHMFAPEEHSVSPHRKRRAPVPQAGDRGD